MENTNIRDILNLVREAEADVASKLDNPELTKAQRSHLRDIHSLLLEFDEILVVEDLNKRVNDLVENSNKIKEINKNIQDKISNLKQFADVFDKVAKVINVMAKGLDAAT